MGRKKRKHASRGDLDVRSLRDEQLREKLSTLLERGKYQRSLEIGKEVRRRGLDEYHDLVEKAYRLRAAELAGKDLYGESAVIVENAMSAGVVSDGLVDLGVHCHLVTGRIEAARGTIEQAKRAGAGATQAAHLLADLAVLARPARTTEEPAAKNTKKSAKSAPRRQDQELPFEIEPALAEDLRRLERAFKSYESGLDEEARTELSGISRRSPLARWRLLLGGLIARATGDCSTARSCWERIPPRGPCGMIAIGLLHELPPEPAGDSASLQTDSNDTAAEPEMALKLSLSQDPRPRLLESIAQCCREDDEPALLSAVKKAVNTWPGGLSARERKRLLRAIGGAIDPYAALYHGLTRYLGDLPESQLGLRQAALVAERSDPQDAHGLWGEYLEDIDDVGFKPRLVPRAGALILERMGDLARDFVEQFSTTECDCDYCGALMFEEDPLCPGAVECYQKSIELDPGEVAVRRKLAAVYKQKGETREAEQVLEELLGLLPSDVETLLELGEAAYKRRAYKKAFKYFEEAYRLEPLNSRVQTKLSECLDASAWRRARKERYDLARKDWQRAVEIWRGSPPADLLIRWSAVEEADGQRARSEEIFHGALDSGISPAEAELKLVEALAELDVRSDFYAEHRDVFTELVHEPQEDSRTVESLGRIYGTVIELSKREGSFSRVHKGIHKYLRRARGVSLELRPRLELCRLFEAQRVFDLAADYAAAGRKQFPEEPHFALHEAEACLELNRDLSKSLRAALKGALLKTTENRDMSMAGRLANVLERSQWHPRKRRKPQRTASVFDKIFADRFED